MTRQDQSPPDQPTSPVETRAPGSEPLPETPGDPPRFEEIFAAPPLPRTVLHGEEGSPSAGHDSPACSLPVVGPPPVDDENPLGVLRDRPAGGRRGLDAAASFEDLVSQMFVDNVEPADAPLPLDFEVERRQLWPWVAGFVALVGLGVAGALLWSRGAGPVATGAGASQVAAVEPTSVPMIPTPEPLPTPAPAPTERAAPASSPTPVQAPAIDDPASLPPATRIQAVRWEPGGDGGTVVLVANGGVVPRRIRHLRLENPPRELVRITGISSGSEPESLAVGGRLVARVRLGHHPELSPPELYVVVDLGTAGARVDEVQSTGSSVRIPIR